MFRIGYFAKIPNKTRYSLIIIIGNRKCFNMDFITRLKELRDDADMKQIELAKKLNVKPSVVSKYENNHTQPNYMTIIKIADVFNVSVDYLLGISSVKNPYTMERYSPKEAELVTRYRKLNNENKIRIDERISAMIDVQRT